MITYPIPNVETKTFSFRKPIYTPDPQDSETTVLSGHEAPVRGNRWPRSDGEQIAKLDPNYILMEEVEGTHPTISDPATQKYGDKQWVDDEPNQVATWTYNIVAKTPEEQAEYATQQDRAAKRGNITLANITTIRNWATTLQGTNLTTAAEALAFLNLWAPRAGTFLDRFADLVVALGLVDEA